MIEKAAKTMLQATDPSKIYGWHLHVYFDENTRDPAQAVRDAVMEKFDVEMGRWHERPIGPHPMWSYQIAVKPDVFNKILPWMALNRQDLIVFVHPETGDDLLDHRDHPIWLGEKVALNLSIFKS